MIPFHGRGMERLRVKNITTGRVCMILSIIQRTADVNFQEMPLVFLLVEFAQYWNIIVVLPLLILLV
jgi:hypothetical protein